MSNQVVIPFPQRPRRETSPISPVGPRRAKLLSRLSTARGVVRAVIDTLSYMGDARVKPPLARVSTLPTVK
jgi:hypothetical protein